MKKSSLKTTTTYQAPNQGTANSRLSKTSPSTATSGGAYDDSEFQLKGDTGQGKGTANSRYLDTKPGGYNHGIGHAQPLKTSTPMHDDITAIGPGVYTKSTPIRKRKA